MLISSPCPQCCCCPQVLFGGRGSRSRRRGRAAPWPGTGSRCRRWPRPEVMTSLPWWPRGHYLRAPHVSAPQGDDVAHDPGNIGGHDASKYGPGMPLLGESSGHCHLTGGQCMQCAALFIYLPWMWKFLPLNRKVHIFIFLIHRVLLQV